MLFSFRDQEAVKQVSTNREHFTTHNDQERSVSERSAGTKKVRKARGQTTLDHLLNLEGWRVSGVSPRKTHLQVEIEMKQPVLPHHCSSLNEETDADDAREIDARTVNIRDLPLRGQYVDLLARRPRLRCRRCNERGKAHAGRDLGKDIHPSYRMTTRLVEYIRVQAASRTFRELGREVGLPEATIRKVFKDDPPPTNLNMQIIAPRVLGIDDKHTRGKRLKTVFVDLEKRLLLDIYDENKTDPLRAFVLCLDKPRRVSVVCIDMSGTYISFCKKYLPWAKIVIDKFHVIMKAYDAVNTARIAAQKSIEDEDEKRELSKLKYVFLRRGPITSQTKDKMNSWLDKLPKLRAVWEAKERFYGFYSQNSAESASEFYQKWLKALDGSTKDSFKKLRSCMKNHNNEILNYFRVTELEAIRKVTNGYTEALNLQISRMLHQAPWYTFETLRHKLLKAYGPNRTERAEFCRRGLKAGGRKRRPKSNKPQPDFGLIPDPSKGQLYPLDDVTTAELGPRA